MKCKQQEALVRTQRVRVSVQFDTVSIQFPCKDEYEAQVLYDDIIERIQDGQELTIKANK